MQKLCGVEFSHICVPCGKDQVSRMAEELDETLEPWRTRLLEKTYPYLMVDASYEYVREGGQVVTKGVLTVKSIDQEGYRKILRWLWPPRRRKRSGVQYTQT